MSFRPKKRLQLFIKAFCRKALKPMKPPLELMMHQASFISAILKSRLSDLNSEKTTQILPILRDWKSLNSEKAIFIQLNSMKRLKFPEALFREFLIQFPKMMMPTEFIQTSQLKIIPIWFAFLQITRKSESCMKEFLQRIRPSLSSMKIPKCWIKISFTTLPSTTPSQATITGIILLPSWKCRRIRESRILPLFILILKSSAL